MTFEEVLKVIKEYNPEEVDKVLREGSVKIL